MYLDEYKRWMAADLEDADAILPHHIAEAVGYRTLDRGVWQG